MILKVDFFHPEDFLVGIHEDNIFLWRTFVGVESFFAGGILLDSVCFGYIFVAFVTRNEPHGKYVYMERGDREEKKKKEQRYELDAFITRCKKVMKTLWNRSSTELGETI